jgi:hypothetical protein
MTKVEFTRQWPARAIFRMAVWMMLLQLFLPPLHLLDPGAGCPVNADGSSCQGHCEEDRAVSLAGRPHSPLDCRLCLELLHVAATPVPVALAGVDLQAAPAQLEISFHPPSLWLESAPWAPRAPPSLLG